MTCNSVSPANDNLPCQNPDSNSEVKWTFTSEDYTEKKISPGTYSFKFDVSVNNDVVTQSFTVDVVLTDPCSPPTVTEPNSDSLVYTITDEKAVLSLTPAY